jgi:hypothetical protein
MTMSAILFMFLSVTSVTVLVVWCYHKVLTTPQD